MPYARSEQQLQQQPGTPDPSASPASSAALWSSPFKKSKRQLVDPLQPQPQQGQPRTQQQQKRQLADVEYGFPFNLPGMQHSDAAAAAAQAAAASHDEALQAAAAARRQRHEQQRQRSMRSMFAPVDAAAAAAAFSLQTGAAVGCTVQIQRLLSDGNNNSSSASWQSSADVAIPTLQSWAAKAEDVGMVPEAQALWWGLGDMYEVWAVAQQGSSEAYARYCRALQQLLDEGSCSQLQSWYAQQQFRLPVVIGAA
jgi:hypothetical protein